MAVKSALDKLLDELEVLWRDMNNGCFSILHPKYPEYGGKGLVVPYEWSQHNTYVGKRNFLAWGIKEVKRSVPGFDIKEPVLHCFQNKGNSPSDWRIVSKIDRDSEIVYETTKLASCNYRAADIVAMRQDARDNGLSIEELSNKYRRTKQAVERALYWKATLPIEKKAPQLNIPYGKKVL